VIVADARPSLRRGIVLRYDRVRARHVLLYPEGVLILNDTAAEVLRHCDGTATVADICARLSVDYQGFRERDVAEVLSRLAERGMIEVTGE
jgi:coenzyme PQQ biosynthesis protein PqqD